jgi:glycosyltransferase involved in cell wall biosynthesis
VKTISVAISTYNHESYLTQAIESVLGQKTVYPYDVLVLDDCSTDGTTGIVNAYTERYPGRIRAIVHPVNEGSIPSFIELLSRVTGDYIATLEGDDYWISDDKLQLQIDFLEAYPQFVLCGHNCIIRNEWTGTESIKMRSDDDLTLTTRHLIDFDIPTASMVFRNHLIDRWPPSLLAAGFEDRPLAIMLSQRGQVRYLRRPMSVYRVHAGGLWSGRYLVDPTQDVLETTPEGYAKLVQFWNALRPYLNHQHDDRIQELVDWVTLEVERQRIRAAAGAK